MVNRFHQICTYLFIALGTIHTLLTPMLYKKLTPNTLWFVGSGLTMIFLGFLNIILRREAGHDRVVRRLCFVANLICCGFGVLALIVIQEPQVLIGEFLLISLTLTSLRVNKQ